MINLYDIEDANKIINEKKNYVFFIILFGIITLSIVIPLTIIINKLFIVIIDTLVVFSYISFIYTYIFFIRKDLNEQYHTLAKIEQFNHEIFTGTINEISSLVISLNKAFVYQLKIGERTIYIEQTKIPSLFVIGNKIKVDLVDNLVVAYEAKND